MVKYEVLGQEVWEGTDEEIRALWNKTPQADRHRFWSHDEVTAHILDNPEQLQVALDQKKAKPGRLTAASPP